MVVALMGFSLSFYLLQGWQNHALWAALSVFMASRSLSLAAVLWWQWRTNTLLSASADIPKPAL